MHFLPKLFTVVKFKFQMTGNDPEISFSKTSAVMNKNMWLKCSVIHEKGEREKKKQDFSTCRLNITLYLVFVLCALSLVPPGIIVVKKNHICKE